MPPKTPITLIGSNLGERHRHLNSLVAKHKDEKFDTIANLQELSTIDRLFKIDLAVKVRNVDYVLKSLKDEDLLYVSRALKCKWLLESQYEHILNPVYLEESLYPEMITTAINKMKHWIQLNLKDEKRAQNFYSYYYDNDRKFALKFLHKCSTHFIIEEFPKMCMNMTPHLLKLLCEKTPIAAKLFYGMVETNEKFTIKYLQNDKDYFEATKGVLKMDSNIFLDILEKYFRNGPYKRLSANATKYIMSMSKERFLKKPELYTSWFLHVQTVAESLNEHECEDLVIQLARCKFIRQWFQYKNVEPFIKRLDNKKRGDFKNKVFVEKDIGEEIKDWPYDIPKEVRVEDDVASIWSGGTEKYDDDNHSDECELMCRPMCYQQCAMLCDGVMPRPKTFLDKLFDEHRFMNFDKTFFELRSKIPIESSAQNRMNMMLVLVSKSGGNTDHLKTLFDLLLHHCNEPAQVRAAVIRSLVKRAFVWRVADDLWTQLLAFGHGLGLDGMQSEADCDEGLHAVVIRDLLRSKMCSPAVKKSYLGNFSTLKEYALTSQEKKVVITALQKLLLSCVVEESNPVTAANTFYRLVDVIEDYKVPADSCSTIIPVLKELVANDAKATEDVIRRLFRAKIGRKELLQENFNLFQADGSYVNALRHNTTVLSAEKFIKALEFEKFDRFLSKISIYFGENGNLCYTFLHAIKERKSERKLARPLAWLIGKEIIPYILEVDGNSDVRVKRYAADVRANAHLARPKIDLNSLGWQTAGVKLISNKIIISKHTDIKRNIEKLLKWNRSLKLALHLASRVKNENEVFQIVAEARPTVALKFALFYFKQQGSQSDSRIWETFKEILQKMEPSIVSNEYLHKKLQKFNRIPQAFKTEYVVSVFPILDKSDYRKSISCLKVISSKLQNVNEDFVNNTLSAFINKMPTIGTGRYDWDYKRCQELYVTILARHLLACKDKDSQFKRYDNLGTPFLNKMETIFRNDRYQFFQIFNVFLDSLLYIEVYRNAEYVSILPVMENIVRWMQNVMPMEKHFGYYVKVHLTMIHFKAMRQIVNNYPTMYDERKNKKMEAIEMFGEIFGRYVAKEANELVDKYFDSIIELYGKHLEDYIASTFGWRGAKTSMAIFKGIINESKGSERRLLIHLLNNSNLRLNDEDKKKAYKLIKSCNDREFQLFYNNTLLLIPN